MTTGLDDSGDLDCTDPECLTYLAAPGTRWSYHNAPYTLLDGVITNATGQSLNSYLLTDLTPATGISGLFLQVEFNNVFFSRPRSMARFGLLALGQGSWNGVPILADTDYFTAMTSPSQALNPAYGYLWWLNGQSNYLLPGVDLLLPGSLMPSAPDDIYAALGKNGQIINVSPSTGLVVVRMGNLPGGIFVPNVYNNDIWEYLNGVICTPTGVGSPDASEGPSAWPNPTTGRLWIDDLDLNATVQLTAPDGRRWSLSPSAGSLDLAKFADGLYHIRYRTPSGELRSTQVLKVQ
jgi:hypothetical protein